MRTAHGYSDRATPIGRFCFSPDTLVHAEGGLRPIRDLKAGDRVWSFRFGVGDWVLRTVAEHKTSTYQGSLTRLRTAGGTVEATGDHPVWVVRGVGLRGRPRCPSLVPTEDEGRTVDGRWVAARDISEGDVLYGRDGGQYKILEARSRDGANEVCTLAVDEHANFAVGTDGVLVHNGTCWRDLIAQASGRAIPAALKTVLLAPLVHGHHIVMKTIPNDIRGPIIEASQAILQRYKAFGTHLLANQTDVTALKKAAGGANVKLYNLCYAANGYQEIHSQKYCQAVLDNLVTAESIGNTPALKASAVIKELERMATILESGGQFW